MRAWDIAMKSEKPVEAFSEMMDSAERNPGPSVDELSAEQQAWLRRT